MPPCFTRVFRSCKAVSSNRQGNIGLIFAVALMAIVGSVGIAIDYGMMVKVKGAADSALDAASLAATSSVRKYLLQSRDDGPGLHAAIHSARRQGLALFRANSELGDHVEAIKPVISIRVNGRKITVESSYTAVYRPMILSTFGYRSVTIAGRQTSTAMSTPYMEVTLLVDTSGSMAFGVDEANQQRLARTTGCVFACHDGVPEQGYEDAFALAVANGITLRVHAINHGIKSLVEEFDRLDPEGLRIKTSVWTFDTYLNRLVSRSLDRWQVTNSLPSTPAVVNDPGERLAATLFNENIGTVVRDIGTGGDCSSSRRPIKLLIIATDGVQDPGRFWVHQEGIRWQVGAFDTQACDTLRDHKVKIGVVHTPFVPMPGEWGFERTLALPSLKGGPGNRLDDANEALKKCGGDNYVVADNAQKIIDGFVTILRNSAVAHVTK